MKKYFFFLGTFLLLFFSASFLDPDFGWHLRTGQLILQSGIPKTDPFSYTMPMFSYVDHAWLTDVLIAKLYPIIGLTGLSTIFAAIGLCSLLVIVGKKFPNPFFLAAVITLSSGIATRPLVITWLFFSVLLKVIFDDNLWNKYKYIIPGYFIIWANLHGGFPVGLILLLFRRNWAIFFLSLIGTLINPYGIGLWNEVFSTMFDSSLRFTILEWLPSPLLFSPTWIILMVFSASIVIRYWKKFPFIERGIYFCFLLFSLSSLRNQSLFAIVSLPLIIKGEFLFITDLGKQANRYVVANKLIWLLVVISGAIALFNNFNFIKNLQEGSYYPRQTVNYLKEIVPQGEVFSIYNWGGYLIWKFPEKKVFIDGRMPSWREPINIFKFSDDIVTGKIDYKPVFTQYNIKTVLWPNTVTKDKFVKTLEGDGWVEIYKDNIAVVYSKG